MNDLSVARDGTAALLHLRIALTEVNASQSIDHLTDVLHFLLATFH